MAAAATKRATRTNAAPRRKPGQGSASRRVSASSRRSAAPTRTRPRPSPAKPQRRRRSATPPAGVVMLPVAAVNGAAGAVGGVADSGFVVGITRGRLWIALLGALLGGIVALNVWGLSLSASTSATAAKIDELERANSVQRARIAKRSSIQRVESNASAELGLGVPSADAVRYVRYRPRAPARAAKRLASGDISVFSALPIAPAFAEAAGAAVAADALAPADPAAETAPPDPVSEAAPPEPAPAAPTPAPATPVAPDPAGGGVSP